jgi:hypothetical protein
MIRKLKELRQEMRRRMHQRLRDQHRWLAVVLCGHYANYFGIPGNSTCLGQFRLYVMKAWRRVLLRRSQRPKLSWERFNAILKVFSTPIGCTRLASPSGLEGEVIAGCPPEIRRQTSCTRDTNLRMMIGLGQPTAGRLDRVAVLWPARDRSSGRNLQRKPPKSRKINREKKPCGTAIGKRARIGSTCSISRTSHTPR